MKLIPDLKEFVELLNSHKVKYLIVGGYAVGVYGFPRYTGDIDIWIGIDDQNAENIVEVLNKFGFSSLGLKKNDFMTPDMVYQFGFPPNRIDILTSVSGLDFDDCYPKKNIFQYEDLEIVVIDLESLIKNKKALNRPKDNFDLENILE